MRPVAEQKAAGMSQPPGLGSDAPRPKHLLRYLLCLTPSVVTPARYGVSVRPIVARLLRSFTSAAVSLFGRWNRLSGRCRRFSVWPEMPRYRSTFSFFKQKTAYEIGQSS